MVKLIKSIWEPIEKRQEEATKKVAEVLSKATGQKVGQLIGFRKYGE